MVEKIKSSGKWVCQILMGVFISGSVLSMFLGLVTMIILSHNFKNHGTFVVSPTHIYIGEANSQVGLDY